MYDITTFDIIQYIRFNIIHDLFLYQFSKAELNFDVGDFGMSSRDLKDYEKELLDYETIARDNIVIIVEENNPLSDITLEELKSIYTGETKNWDDLNQ